MSVNTNLNFTQTSAILNSLVHQATGSSVIASTEPEFISVAQTALRTDRDAIFNAISVLLSKTIFSTRPYSAKFKGLEKSMPQWGAYMRKLSISDKDWGDDNAYKYPVTFEAGQNPPSGDSHTVDQWIIKKPDIVQTNFYGQSVFMDWYSVFEDQLETAFSGSAELAQFMSMITQNMSNRLEQARESMARGILANFIGGILVEGNNDRVVHLLTEYNALTGGNYTAQSIYMPGNFAPFMKWVYSRIAQVSSLMTERSQMFQTVISGKSINRHTPMEKQKVYMYAPSRFQMDALVIADTYHDNYLKYSDVETVNFWQSIDTPDSIAVKPTYTNTTGTAVTGNLTEQAGIFAVIFDEDAMGYALTDTRVVPTGLNGSGLYRNMWYHSKIRCFSDNTEKGVVFLLD